MQYAFFKMSMKQLQKVIIYSPTHQTSINSKSKNSENCRQDSLIIIKPRNKSPATDRTVHQYCQCSWFLSFQDTMKLYFSTPVSVC